MSAIEKDNRVAERFSVDVELANDVDLVPR